MLYIFLIKFLVIFVTLYFSIIRSNYPIHMLQLEGYENDEYLKWISENKDKVTKLWYKKQDEEKSPLVWTDRAKRLMKKHELVNIIIVFIICIVADIIYLFFDNIAFLVIFLLITGFLLYFYQYKLIVVSNKFAIPKELEINMGFYKQAQEKIRNYKENYDLKVLGITGSFGKTSVKFISNTILSEGLRVKNTPSSFNTPMGLSKIINNELENTTEVFIAELGAKKRGEIEEVAALVQPNIGIITAIGPTHMHLFKTIDNIQNTKYELIEMLPENGVAIFNYDNDYVKPLADKTEIKTIRYGIKDVEKLDVYATDISVDEMGSKFILHIRELGEIECESKLLGVHNISNLLAAASSAYILGLSLEQIANGMKKVEPVEHRLNIVNSNSGVIVIDDAFNSNPIGFRAALDVISEFKDGRKIIITPGMVELGDMEEEENYKIGFEIAKTCDFVILVGKKRTAPIYRGLEDAKYNLENVFRVNSLNEATQVLGHLSAPKDVVLFENDLPDNYSEQ
ncbi:UDP-N-acetylmuramoyl-tripeptide--D-alanyl-D-alanine ligase [Peptoniphilus sp. oral taxon 386]|uniref:UDP-N-acetylmuramoyl-tripeptide--D-alanyl-D- alanine ligase n=1 Tax=Peptoniphilus sp. oral taxon 386 TaxID=652713 RepID=UPI0001DA9ED6|nr:UDP-N-acetylmuramoyl-tripeptide--D-alanyl-D-alanine ligase [Peptoniphilus sp. oral taxon 386]EFI41516.1 UDP-N-acetylmuramoyl-tripeptide--D-alanyl-D-alanine ligase [Peptoniphilus sp. oral taxon 386 str. F0131]